LFAQQGAQLVLIGRREKEGSALQAALVSEGHDVTFIPADLSRTDDIAPTFDKAVARYGRLDAVFNNAGAGGGRATIDSGTPAAWDALMDINFKSAFFCLQAQIAHMRKAGGGGSILFNASVLGSVGFPGTVAYGASKGGVITMARSAAVELGPERIRVNTLSPSVTRTPMTEARFAKNEDGEEVHPFAALTPLRRTAEPMEIAYAALFLLSDEASFITGHDLIVDGGISAG
jgi:NAD(P)-dependent dehydrogenase (short-subunit alcohol dehydrogenase family)